MNVEELIKILQECNPRDNVTVAIQGGISETVLLSDVVSVAPSYAVRKASHIVVESMPSATVARDDRNRHPVVVIEIQHATTLVRDY